MEPIDIETEDEKRDPEPEYEEEPELYNCKMHKGVQRQMKPCKSSS
jgi:hypothetical protein